MVECIRLGNPNKCHYCMLQSGLIKSGNGLSPRQVEILLLMAEGFGHKEIAFHLGMSYQTVKNHSVNIRSSLDAVDEANAVHLAHLAGIFKAPVPA